MECRLEKPDLKFAEDLALAIGDKRVQINLRDGLPNPYTVENAREFITAMQAEDNVNFTFFITLDGKFAGVISATRQQNIHSRTAEVGYYVTPSLWGRGTATSAIKQISKYIFDNTDIIRLFAEPFARNLASCRVLEKAGFKCEGVLRSNAVKCGVVEDMKMYALIKN